MSLSISPSLIIATQALGKAAGNMIAIHNVVASATVGLLGQEGATLRRTILPTIYYVLFTGIIAMLALYVFNIIGPLAYSRQPYFFMGVSLRPYKTNANM